MNVRVLASIVFAAIFSAATSGPTTASEDVPACRVAPSDVTVELHSPAFVFRLDASDGLRAVAWENRLTGRTLSLGNGPEVEFDVGLPDQPLKTPQLRVIKLPATAQGACGEAVFELEAKDPQASVTVTYRWDAKQPVLRKLVTITNRSGQEWNRLLNVRLGDYRTAGVTLLDKAGHGTPDGFRRPFVPRALAEPNTRYVERGFPAYLADEFFVSLAHPAGVAEAAVDQVSLRQYPGERLRPGEAYRCMETIYGVARAGAARTAFVDHVAGRMRRVVRGHDRPYAIFDNFGSWPYEPIDSPYRQPEPQAFNNRESHMLHSLERLGEFQRATGCRFDLCSIDFWVDVAGDLKQFDRVRFPNGIVNVQRKLDALGIAPGLWIDSTSCEWSIGDNPATHAAIIQDAYRPGFSNTAFCRATEPIRSMYTEAFVHHVRAGGVRLLKFDNFRALCDNAGHEHLPGLYSTEPIVAAMIEFLQALDDASPDVFLMLYWGFKSPWWLVHGDTLFDAGLDIEAASPSELPAPYARHSITQKLDQAQKHVQDVPWLGKDSLGVWLSDWGWNSEVGKERWQEGFVMDLCRGSLLAQPWADRDWLSPPEWQQMADFISLLRARPGCFRNPRFVLGDPHEYEPYGYCCSDGKRAILALDNCTWEDRVLKLRLNSAWGLPDGKHWDLYRWYPDPARLHGGEPPFGETADIVLRPFEVVLLEVVPAGEKPSLDRRLEERPIPVEFATASRDVDLSVQLREDADADADVEADAKWQVLEVTSAASAGGATLRGQDDGSVLASGKTSSPDTYTITADTSLAGITAIRLEALPDPSLPGRGPGRAVNGNFALTGIRVKAFPRGERDQALALPLGNPKADFAQEGYGGWPVTAALDGDPKTGWSIHPEEGQPHEAVFETQKPVGFEGGTTLLVELDQGEREHSLGRFRLAATAARPVPAPRRRVRQLVVRGDAPPSPEGGLLVVTVEMSQNGRPTEIRNVGRYVSAEGRVGGKPIAWQPVLGKATYPSCWQAWRLPLEPSSRPLDFELLITPRVGAGVDLRCAAHFMPR
jgi:hypothetical protein